MEQERVVLSLIKRDQLQLYQVTEVFIFQEQQAQMATQNGVLQITGEGMHLEKLDLEKGEAVVSGRIDSLYFPEDGQEHRKGLLSRLFR